jgi:adenosylhomocysteine nucleosidase
MSTGCTSSHKQVTGILGAFELEVAGLKDELDHAHTHTIQGIAFHSGEVQGRSVVIAVSGIGKVNAAVAVSLLIEHYEPSEVLVVGIAGALNPELEPGDVVIAKRVAHHDQGEYTPDGFWPRPSRSPFSGGENPPFFIIDNDLLELAKLSSLEDAADIESLDDAWLPVTTHVGAIVSGDSFIASPAKRSDLRQLYNADAVDMESAAIAQVCWQHGVPFLAIKGISDRADEGAIPDARAFTEIAALNASALTRRILNELCSESRPE